jgi:hypothetical protein
MFHLHDTTRRRIGLTGFLMLGVLPALLVVGWCVDRRLPGRIEAESELLSQRLGLNVKLGELRHLQPGVTLYEGLEAADPETGRRVFRCRLLEISKGQQTDAQGQRRPTLTVIASQPEIEADALDRIWQCLQRTLEGFHGPLETDVQISASELTLQSPRDAQTLTDVKATLENLTGGVCARMDFRLVGADTPEPARISIGRDRQTSPPTTRFELYTGDGELPCNVLAMGVDELKPLGPRSRFRGYIWASEMPDGWQGEVSGKLVELDIGRLVSDYFPHRLAGMGEVTIRSARFRHGRLEEGNADVEAGPGTIDRSLMEAAVDRLGLVAGQLPPADSESISYDQLAFVATLDAQGLRLSGRCDASEPGVILSQGRQCLLGQSSRQSMPVVAFVRTLVPQSEVQVPASRQTDWLLRHLPVPEIMSIPGSDTLPHARVHWNEALRR